MSWSLNFAVTGDEQVALELRGLALRVADASPAFELLEQAFERNEARWFRTAGSRTWPPLSAATHTDKFQRGYPPDSLIRSGRLHASLTERTDDSVRFVGPNTLVFGTSVPYARFHRYGTTHMPERNPLVRTLFLEEETVATLSDFLVGPIFKRNRRAFGARKQRSWL